MKVLRTYRDVPPAARGAVVALGNFDGVHLGHQVVIDAARTLAGAMGAPLGVMVFEPHPRSFFAPDAPAFRLMSLETKCRVLSGLGVEIVYALPFDHAFAAQSAQDFVMDVLVRGIGVCHVVAGPDFRFGKGRAGDMTMLSYMGEAEGFGVSAVDAFSLAEGAPQVSSTAIRSALKSGEPEIAAAMLGRHWCVEGPVRDGDKRGRTIGFPTANLPLDGLIEPRFGVYAVRVEVLEGPHAGAYDGVANVGRRPTFGPSEVGLEAHLFDFSGDLYGTPISVGLIAFIREERKFDGLEALKAQISRDCEAARTLLRPV